VFGHKILTLVAKYTAGAQWEPLATSGTLMRPHDPITSMHVNARHHSVALVGAPVRSMHHLMVEYYQLDDVGQGYDLLHSTPEKILATLGRHPNDLMTSYYMRTPCEIYVECGWWRQGGRRCDSAGRDDECRQLLGA